MNKLSGEPVGSDVERGAEGKDPVLEDVIPYCSDPEFIRQELVTARKTGDPLSYLEKRMKEIEGGRKGDIRILLNRLARLGR
ncbi:MAG: hypothetical protein ACMUHM_09625 [Thermoplasmatota archaeon]